MKFTKRQAPGSSGGVDKYLKFKDGESKFLLLRGEIYEFYMKWVNGKSLVVEPTDPEGKSRFRVNSVVEEEGKLAVKIWEFPLAVYRALGSINEEYPLETIWIKVTRHGTSTNTEYNILPLLNRNKVDQAKMDKLDLHILNNKPAQSNFGARPNDGATVGSSHWEDTPMPDESDEIPF